MLRKLAGWAQLECCRVDTNVRAALAEAVCAAGVMQEREQRLVALLNGGVLSGVRYLVSARACCCLRGYTKLSGCRAGEQCLCSLPNKLILSDRERALFCFFEDA